MLSGISGSGSYFRMYNYGSSYGNGNLSARTMQVRRLQNAASTEGSQAASVPGRASQPSKTGIQAYPRADEEAQGRNGIFIRKGADPAEYAVRMRMQNVDPEASDLKGQGKAVGKGEAAEKAYDDGKCQTCEQRKYQDGSDDMGVSFKTPKRVAPEAAASAVRSHEQEHVSREQAKAKREDRRVVSQSVTLHTSVCPECGRVYVSGGTTRTTTASNPPKQNNSGQGQQQRRAFSAVA